MRPWMRVYIDLVFVICLTAVAFIFGLYMGAESVGARYRKQAALCVDELISEHQATFRRGFEVGITERRGGNRNEDFDLDDWDTTGNRLRIRLLRKFE